MKKKLQGVTCRVHRGSHELIFLKPQTYMNASGESVRAALAWYDRFSTEAGDNQEIPRLVIVHDDLDLALGSYKLQFASGPKAHNGLNSIRDHLHTQKFWVARVGIDGRNGDRSIPGEAYVLQPFSAPEQSTLKEISANIASELEYVVLQ